MAAPHGLVQKDEEAAIAAARQGISNGSRSINDLPGSVSFSAALSLQAKMCRQRLRRRVETDLSSCPPEIRTRIYARLSPLRPAAAAHRDREQCLPLPSAIR